MARPRKEKPPLAVHLLQPLVLPVDWLTVNIRIPHVDTRLGAPTPFVGNKGRFNGLTYEKVGGPTRVWNRIDNLYDYHGQLMAEVHSGPRSEMLFDANEVQVKADNRTFYDGRWNGVFGCLLDGEGWSYQAISQLDIAADGVGFLEPFTRYVHDEIETSCRAKLRFGKPQNGKVDELILGSRKGGKYARCYYKREELAVSGKTYIDEYWRANGIAPEVRVDRLEVSMKGTEIRRYFGGDNADEWGEVVGDINERSQEFLSALAEPHKRAVMYHSAMRKMIAWRERESSDGRSRSKRSLVDWDFSFVTDREVVPVQRAPRVSDIGLNSMKTTIRNNYLCSCADGGRPFLSIVQQQVAAFGLEAWYHSRRPHWDFEFRKFVEARGMRAHTLFDHIRLTMGDER